MISHFAFYQVKFQELFDTSDRVQRYSVRLAMCDSGVRSPSTALCTYHVHLLPPHG